VGVVPLEPSGQPSRHFGFVSFVQGTEAVGLQIRDQHDPLGIGMLNLLLGHTLDRPSPQALQEICFLQLVP